MQRIRQILGTLFTEDVMKQNHNDDAKPGRALESNQSLLFDKLHSSESSEQQQQRICGPLAALTFNLVVAVGIIFMNKWVLKNVGFQFPVFLTVIHYAVSWALLAIVNFFSLFSASPPSKLAPLSLFTFGVVNSVSTGLANVSLKYNSVGFYQMAKISITPLIVLLEFIWYRKRIAFSKVIALTVVSIGVAVATVTDLQFSLFGACVALAWILPSAVNKILWSNVQQRESWTELALMWKTTPITLFFFGFYDSFLGSSWCPCIPLELQQYISNSHVCFSWLLASVVECFDTWGYICYLLCCSWTIQNVCCTSWKLLPFWLKSWHNQYFWSIHSHWWHVLIHIPQYTSYEAAIQGSVALEEASSFLKSKVGKGNKENHDAYDYMTILTI